MMIFMMVYLFAIGLLLGFAIGLITQYYRIKRILGFEYLLPLTTTEKKRR